MDLGGRQTLDPREGKKKGRKVVHLNGLWFGPPDRNRTCI